MEKPPSVVSVEDKEKEISPEKRKELWKTLRYVALGGLVTFGGYEAVQQMEKQKADKAKADIEQTLEQTREQNDKEVETMARALGEESFTIKNVVGETKIVDGKKVTDADIVMMDGKEYKTKVETDVVSTEDKTEGKSERIDWNRSFLSSLDRTGSGVQIFFNTTSEGLKMTVKEFDKGEIVNERVSVLQEVNK